MATQIRTVYEGLGGNYRTQLRPPDVQAHVLQPRMPLTTPISSVPGPPTPLPTTTQQNKKTNVQIPVARMSLAPILEGSIVFVERKPHYKGAMRGPSTPLTVTSLRGLNAYLHASTTKAIAEGGLLADAKACRVGLRKLAFGVSPEAEAFADVDEFPWELDGVVNNSETDAHPEDSSAVITNVAVQGPCRLINNDEQQRCEMQKSHAGSVLYVGVWKRIYVPYALTPGSANESKWQTLMGLPPADRSVRTDVLPELRCTEYVSCFSSAQLASGEYEVMNADPSRFPYATAAGSYVHDVILTNKQVLGSVGLHNLEDRTAGAGAPPIVPIKPFFGKGSLSGSWGFDYLIDLWKLGTSMDSNQSPGGMLTVNVNIEHLPRFRALDKDIIDEQMLIEGPKGWYHRLRLDIGGTTTSLQELHDKGPIFNPALRAQIESDIRSDYGKKKQRKKKMFEVILENLKIFPSTYVALLSKAPNLDVLTDAQINFLMKASLQLDPGALYRTFAGQRREGEMANYADLADVDVLAAWDRFEDEHLIAKVAGRPHLGMYLHDLWASPKATHQRYHGARAI